MTGLAVKSMQSISWAVAHMCRTYTYVLQPTAMSSCGTTWYRKMVNSWLVPCRDLGTLSLMLQNQQL